MLSSANGKPGSPVTSNPVVNETANTTANAVQASTIQQGGPSAARNSDEQAIYMLIGSGLLTFSFLTRQLSRRRKLRATHSTVDEFHSVNSKAP
jgi:hypothetical protein